MQERITKALTGADPLTTAAVRRAVGGRKHGVSTALLEVGSSLPAGWRGRYATRAPTR